MNDKNRSRIRKCIESIAIKEFKAKHKNRCKDEEILELIKLAVNEIESLVDHCDYGLCDNLGIVGLMGRAQNRKEAKKEWNEKLKSRVMNDRNFLGGGL